MLIQHLDVQKGMAIVCQESHDAADGFDRIANAYQIRSILWPTNVMAAQNIHAMTLLSKIATAISTLSYSSVHPNNCIKLATLS